MSTADLSEDFATEYGIAGYQAPEFRFDQWLANVEGSLRLADIVEPVIYLYNFQSWCPGCHSHGFPTMKRVKEHFEQNGRGDQIKFVAVQTVFEGYEANTEAAALETMERHGLTDIALGHDVADQADQPPTIMADYRTGGTPWSVIIGPGPDRPVLAEGFQVDADATIASLDRFLTELSPDNARNEKTVHRL